MSSRKRLQLNLPQYVVTALKALCPHEAFVVGGAIRDCVLGRSPSDFDITTSATPDEIVSAFEGYRIIPTGIKHGTVTVLIDGHSLEITTYRSDGVYSDHRRPESVAFSTDLEEDLKRRDFTINAMAYDGEYLIDCFDGEIDASNHLIRAVGDAEIRFDEDALRILRALRFSSQLSFDIEQSTAEAIHTSKELLRFISAERIRDELCRLLTGDNVVSVLREYRDVLAVVIPEIEPCYDFDQRTPYHAYDVWEHTLRAIAASQNDLRVRLSLLLHDIGKPSTMTVDERGQGHFYGHERVSGKMTASILARLRFDNAISRTVTTLVVKHMLFPVPDRKHVLRLLNELGEDVSLTLLEVVKCDRVGQGLENDHTVAVVEEMRALVKQAVSDGECYSLGQLQISGDDIVAMGVRGKSVGDILDELLQDVITGQRPNERDKLLLRAQKLAKRRI